jgi:hypothetical protein
VLLLISSLTCGRSLGRVSLGFFHGLQQARSYTREKEKERERAIGSDEHKGPSEQECGQQGGLIARAEGTSSKVIGGRQALELPPSAISEGKKFKSSRRNSNARITAVTVQKSLGSKIQV